MEITINIPALDNLAEALKLMSGPSDKIGSEKPKPRKAAKPAKSEKPAKVEDETDSNQTEETAEAETEEKPAPKKRTPRKRSVKKDPEPETADEDTADTNESDGDDAAEDTADTDGSNDSDSKIELKDVQQKLIDLAAKAGREKSKQILTDHGATTLLKLDPKKYAGVIAAADKAMEDT